MGFVSLGSGLKILFSLLGCMTTGSVIYTCVIDGLPFRKEILTPWMTATLTDSYIHAIAIGAWICYKESSWIKTILWMVSLVCTGSISTCFYVARQFLKLSPKESTKEPIYRVLQRDKKKSKADDMHIFTVAIARALFSGLGCLMLGTLIYTIVKAGSPFHRHVLFPWLSTTLIGFYVNVVPLLVWIAYKELSLMRSAIWMLLLICSGSIGTCTYIVFQLHKLESEDPPHLVLFNRDDRLQHQQEMATEKDSNTTSG